MRDEMARGLNGKYLAEKLADVVCKLAYTTDYVVITYLVCTVMKYSLLIRIVMLWKCPE